MPDLLLEIIGELDREVRRFSFLVSSSCISSILSKNKQQGGKSTKPEVDRYFAELNNLISQKEIDHTQ